MAWYDNFPSSGGGDWLSGLSDPYGSYMPDGLAGQLPNWYDRFPGAGLSPAAGPDLGGGMTPNYGLAGLYSGGASPLVSQLLGLPTYAPQASSFSAFTAPWAGGALPLGTSGFGQQGFGSGGLPSLGFNQQGIGGSRTLQSPQMGRGVGGGQQSLGGLPQQMPGYGQPQQGYGQQQGYAPQQTGYSGGTSNPANVGGGSAGRGGFVSPVPDGGVYGAQKWSTSMGSNAVDIFVPRGTPVRAPVSGTLQMGQNGQLLLLGDNGLSFAFRHGQTTAQGHVQAGQQIGVVNDPGMDMLGRPGFGNMPDGYQHLELSVSNGNYFPMTPGGGGSIDAAQWLESIGYRGEKMQRTPGPPDAQGGGMGMGMGQGGFPGMQGGFPGMQGSPFGGNPMSMFSGGMGPGGFGQGGLGGLPGFNPMMAMFSGGFGR